MNKTELITFLRDPNQLSSEQLEELKAIVDEHPYFLSARLLLAKASKEQSHPQTKKRIASAAIYSTDRILLKKYLNGNLFFLSHPVKVEEEQLEIKEKPTSKVQPAKSEKKIPIISKEAQPSPPKKEIPKPETSKSEAHKVGKPKASFEEPTVKKPKEEAQRTDKRPSALKAKESKQLPQVPDFPTGELDSILEELERDMENLKASRHKFAEVQQKIEEDDAVSKALQRASSKDDSKPSETKKVEKEKVIPETQTEDKSAEEAKKSASEITMQILDAAKKAKEEVAQEDAAERELSTESKETKTQVEETTSKEAAKDEPRRAAKTPDTEESNQSEKTDESDSDRAERVIREPRFSRFATRSYLKPPEDIDASSFHDENKEKVDSKEEKTRKEIKPKEAETIETKSSSEDESDSSKIKLPDLSKAKPVARRSKRKTKKVDSKEEPGKKAGVKETLKDKEKEAPKNPTPKSNESKIEKTDTKAKKAEEKPKQSEETKSKPVKKTATSKKSTTKATSKKATEKKTVAKKTSTKKEGTKKATKTKSSTKTKTDSSKEDKKDDGKGDRKPQQDIIDKFIKESPTIKYQRTEEATTQDLAEQSAAWDSNLASEYLAEIYLHQGNKKRAIEIYEALSLKYPEKKSYFADLISKIE